MTKIRTIRALASIVALFTLTALFGTSVVPAASAATTYQVVFKPNGGYGTMTTQNVPSTGKALTKNKFKKTGMAFSGWSLTTTGAVKYKDAAVLKPRAKTVLYANWAVAVTLPTLAGHTVGALLWSDEFVGANGGLINSTNWTSRYCGHDAANGGGTCHNAEPQWYTPDAIRLDGTAQGNAVITTTRVSSAPSNAGQCMVGQCFYTSGRFDTQGKVSFQYGYIEARMKMPTGGNNWPAFWALGDNITDVGWPRSGEIDIAETGGNTPLRASSAIHYANGGGGHEYVYKEVVNGTNYQADFHTYGLAWTPNSMQLYVDRQLFWTQTTSTLPNSVWSFNEPFFLILDNATGGFGGPYDGWAKSYTTIDYVRAWALDGNGSVIKQ